MSSVKNNQSHLLLRLFFSPRIPWQPSLGNSHIHSSPAKVGEQKRWSDVLPRCRSLRPSTRRQNFLFTVRILQRGAQKFRGPVLLRVSAAARPRSCHTLSIYFLLRGLRVITNKWKGSFPEGPCSLCARRKETIQANWRGSLAIIEKIKKNLETTLDSLALINRRSFSQAATNEKCENQMNFFLRSSQVYGKKKILLIRLV